MAGTSIGMGKSHFTGLRVSVPPTYIPAYEKNGGTISSCLKVKVFCNRKNDRSDVFDLTMWGKLADAGAKSLSVGKEIHVEARPESYDARIWNEDDVVITKKDGTPQTVRKINFVVTDIVFGSESDKHIQAEIAAGKRPANYNDGGQGSEDWRAMLKARSAYVYNGQTKMFGFANVRNAGTTGVAAQQSLQTQVTGAVEGTDAVQAAFGGVQQVASDVNPF